MHVFVPLVLRIPSRSTDVHFAIQFVHSERMEGKRRKGVVEWSFPTITNLADISGKKNYCPDFELCTMSKRGWMFTCINVKTLEEFFLCLLEREGGRIARGIYIYTHTRHSFAKGRIEVFSLVKKTFHEEEYIYFLVDLQKIAFLFT